MSMICWCWRTSTISTARMQQAIGRKNNPHLNGGRGSKEVEVIELDDD